MGKILMLLKSVGGFEIFGPPALTSCREVTADERGRVPVKTISTHVGGTLMQVPLQLVSGKAFVKCEQSLNPQSMSAIRTSKIHSGTTTTMLTRQSTTYCVSSAPPSRQQADRYRTTCSPSA